jgi:hypothetical protein
MVLQNACFDTFDAVDGAQSVISRLNELARMGTYVFRGYGKQDELIPRIIRDGDYSNIENKFLKDFEKYGSNYFHATTPIDFMSFAQHFGLPTRLLDFTYNPFIALSFALYSKKSNGAYKVPEDKNYYYIRCASIKDNLCLSSISLKHDLYNNQLTRTDSLATKACQCIDSVNDFFGKNWLRREAFDLGTYKDTNEPENGKTEKKIKNRAILFIDPNQSNQRIIMQQGLFMFPYTLDLEEHLSILEGNSFCIKVHKDLRKELIQYLDTLGYNTFHLMPDLSSICDAIKHRNVDERIEKSPLFKKRKV